MLYLVVPPIIVIVCIAFLLWYLSRKETDPAVVNRMIEEATESPKVSFPRTKEFFLRILEKFGQRFKVFSLKAHNSLHDFTQSVKASRVRVHTALTVSNSKNESSIEAEPPKPDIQDSFRQQPSQKSRRSFESILSVPITRHNKTVAKEPVTAPITEGVFVPPRPMVSALAVEPERKKIIPDGEKEETLIARIAQDPKDFTAYEELGDYYMEIRNIKDAKECYRQVLKLSPVHRMVKIKIRRLEKLLTRGTE